MTPFTIIAIHGNGGGGFRFSRMEPYIPAEIQFTAVTLPGFAAKPRQPELQSMHDYAQELHKLITAAQPTKPIILLGTGIGGSIALEYIQHHSHNVAGLILHAPVGTRLDERLFPRLMSLPGMAPLGQWLFSSTLTRPLFRRLLFVNPDQIPSAYLTQFFDEYRHCTVFKQMFEIITRDWWESLKPSDIPTALLWGERERVLSVDQLDDYKTLLPHHLVRTVPDWDHFPMIEQPQAYTAEIISLSRQLLTHIQPSSG